ncbi:hypothetical protein CC78DRAFT_548809 [Lojkania enalia]|uniref:Transposase n=1 Tax=Lojkania enalia TaxID=147567 RepID=A0A9P4JYB8_9PLEO|nr:hypothetical protein CC78DRAFT_548809 [Didymosphaeria enalia]
MARASTPKLRGASRVTFLPQNHLFVVATCLRNVKENHLKTPPPVVAPNGKEDHEQLETPQRSAVLAVLWFAQKTDTACSYQDIEEIFGIDKSACSRLVKSNRARRLQNSDEPDSRGALRELTNAIASYIDQCPFEEKGDPWGDLAERAGVVSPEGKDHWARQTIQKRMTEVSGIKTHTAAVKVDHPPRIRQERVQWCVIQLELRPHGIQTLDLAEDCVLIRRGHILLASA